MRSLKDRRASPYIIRQVDGDECADDLRELQEPFVPVMPVVDTSDGWWWIAYHKRLPAAYLGVIVSTYYPDTLYFKRVGVLPEHRGNSLQRRLMRVMELFARRRGFIALVSDTTENPCSANNFISAGGWKLFEPEYPWAFSNTLYWRKDLL
jgi:GNAT superfamily N-acetyltransferase